MIKHDEKRTVGRACSPEKKPESPSEDGEKSSVSSFHRTLSSSSDPPGSGGEATSHRVTFADDVMETAEDKDEVNVQVPQGSSYRTPKTAFIKYLTSVLKPLAVQEVQLLDIEIIVIVIL